jgi:glucose/mannose transport system permease protein
MTGGGPGIATTMPAVYVIQMITVRQNVGQGMAAATMMLVPIIVLLSIVGIVGWRRRLRAEAGA